jgi:hypothetical protein
MRPCPRLHSRSYGESAPSIKLSSDAAFARFSHFLDWIGLRRPTGLAPICVRPVPIRAIPYVRNIGFVPFLIGLSEGADLVKGFTITRLPSEPF